MEPRRLRSQPQIPNLEPSSGPLRARRVRAVVVSAVVLVATALLIFFWLFRPGPPKPFATVMTVGGPGFKIANSTLPDLFRGAVDDDNQVYLSAGNGDRLHRATP